MAKEEAILEIQDILSEIQNRALGFSDWKGDTDFVVTAENIYNIAHEAE